MNKKKMKTAVTKLEVQIVRIRYTYNVYFKNFRLWPLFTLSVISFPEEVSSKAFNTLQRNVGKVSNYVLQLKSLEVLE